MKVGPVSAKLLCIVLVSLTLATATPVLDKRGISFSHADAPSADKNIEPEQGLEYVSPSQKTWKMSGRLVEIPIEDMARIPEASVESGVLDEEAHPPGKGRKGCWRRLIQKLMGKRRRDALPKTVDFVVTQPTPLPEAVMETSPEDDQMPSELDLRWDNGDSSVFDKTPQVLLRHQSKSASWSEDLTDRDSRKTDSGDFSGDATNKGDHSVFSDDGYDGDYRDSSDDSTYYVEFHNDATNEGDLSDFSDDTTYESDDKDYYDDSTYYVEFHDDATTEGDLSDFSDDTTYESDDSDYYDDSTYYVEFHDDATNEGDYSDFSDDATYESGDSDSTHSSSSESQTTSKSASSRIRHIYQPFPDESESSLSDISENTFSSSPNIEVKVKRPRQETETDSSAEQPQTPRSHPPPPRTDHVDSLNEQPRNTATSSLTIWTRKALEGVKKPAISQNSSVPSAAELPDEDSDIDGFYDDSEDESLDDILE